MTQHRITIVETEDCGWCGLCELVCPNNAIICEYEIVFDNRA
ncbi:MAG: 4Fe-4S binding protein [Dehalococcoidales bacterium]|nr:MAG: 4Fe-4S binding protein [Dehalococcoidales bacterium]